MGLQNDQEKKNVSEANQSHGKERDEIYDPEEYVEPIVDDAPLDEVARAMALPVFLTVDRRPFSSLPLSQFILEAPSNNASDATTSLYCTNEESSTTLASAPSTSSKGKRSGKSSFRGRFVVYVRVDFVWICE